MEKSVVGQVITLKKSVITQKGSSITTIASIKHDQVMNKTYNTGLQSMKVLAIMKT